MSTTATPESTGGHGSLRAVSRATRRTVLYLTLGAAAGVFVLPFAWLVATSLKSIDLALALPPSFVPTAFYAPLDGETRDVLRDYAVTQPGVVARITAGPRAGQTVALSPTEAEQRAGDITVLHRFEPGWWRITERLPAGAPGAPRWDIVPPGTIEQKVKLRWENYPQALAKLGGGAPGATFGRFLVNTLVVCVLGVVGTVLSNAIVAYGFARLHWRGRDAFFALTLATMMVPFPVLMIPQYGVFKSLGLVGTLVPLWLPSFFGSAFNIFLMRQFFRTIPEELSEAARIDGCSEWRIFWQIILPLAKPVLVAAGLFHFLYAWNDFLGPLLYLTRTEDSTLALALQSFQSQTGGVNWHYLMAASAVMIAPTILLFFLAQKTFIQGIATTGSKS